MNPFSLKGQFHEVKWLQNQFHANLLVPDLCIIANSKSNANLLKIIVLYFKGSRFVLGLGFAPKNFFVG